MTLSPIHQERHDRALKRLTADYAAIKAEKKSEYSPAEPSEAEINRQAEFANYARKVVEGLL